MRIFNILTSMRLNLTFFILNSAPKDKINIIHWCTISSSKRRLKETKEDVKRLNSFQLESLKLNPISLLNSVYSIDC